MRYLHLHVRGATTSLVVDGGTAMFAYAIHEPVAEAVDQVGDGAVAVMHNVVRDLCGPDFRPTEAWFAHRKPADVGPFRRFFRVPLRFDAEQFALLFSARYLNRRLPVDDGDLRRLLQAHINALEERHGGDFPEQVRGALRTALMTGHANADHVAALFGMHSRTLHRRLDAFGIGFQQLVDESRFAIARQMLEGSAMGVGQVAECSTMPPRGCLRGHFAAGAAPRRPIGGQRGSARPSIRRGTVADAFRPEAGASRAA